MNFVQRIQRRIKKFLPRDPQNYQVMGDSLVDHHSQIGDYTYIGFNCIVTKAQIGRYCSIANNINIGPGEHDMTQISTSSQFYTNPYEKLTEKPIQIGNDVWIGSNCIIRRGVKIADGAVIGANSFVNEDVPAFAIYAGSPAKFIRFRFDETKRLKILDSKWWDKDLAEAKKIIQTLEMNHG